MEGNKWQVIMDIQGIKKQLLESGFNEEHLDELILELTNYSGLKKVDLATLQKVRFRLQDLLDFVVLRNFEQTGRV